MSITLNNIQTQLNSYIADTSTDRVSAAERYQYITEATTWLQTELDNDHSVKTYAIQYFDSLNYYKLNAALSDVLESNALRRATTESNVDLTRKDARAITIDISQHQMESAYALERRDSNLFAIINHESKYTKLQVSTFDSLTSDGGTWTADNVNSDATNLRVDNTDGSNSTTGCLAFDINVTQSANNLATIYNTGLVSEDLTDEQDLTTWILDFKLPTIADISSITFYWGTDTSNYWSVTATTQYDGSAFIIGWNTATFQWLGATMTGTPTITNIQYIRVDINYTSGQTNATSFKLDNLRLVQPETLTLSYTSWNVGVDASGNPLKAFGNTTDVPYFSGLYDNYLYAVAHKAAAYVFRSLRLYDEAKAQDADAQDEMERVKQVIPKSRPAEMKSFRVRGVRFERGGRTRRRTFYF